MWRPVPAQVAWFRGSVHRALSLSARLLGPPRQPMNLARVPRRSFAFSRGATQEVDENEAQAEAASAALSVNRSFPASPLQGVEDTQRIYRAAAPPKTQQTANLGEISNDLLVSLSMAHGNDARSMEGLVENLRKNGLIRSDRVFQAMLKFDRGEFMPRMLRQSAYFDRPQELGFRATISAPHMHAIALEQLLDCLQPGMTVLDIGAGSGYLSACFADLVSPGGQVCAIEHVPELVRRSKTTLRRLCPELLDQQTVKFFAADPLKDATMLKGSKFDAIHCGAAVECIPQLFLDLLSEGGKLLVPVAKAPGSLEQSLQLITRRSSDDGRPVFVTETVMSCIYSGLYENPHPSEHDSAAAVEDDSEAAADHVVTPQILARKMELGQAVQKYTQLTLQFKAWQENFKLQNNGDRPTLNQMMADPEAGQLMQDMNLFKEVVLILRHRRQERENPP